MQRRTLSCNETVGPRNVAGDHLGIRNWNCLGRLHSFKLVGFLVLSYFYRISFQYIKRIIKNYFHSQMNSMIIHHIKS